MQSGQAVFKVCPFCGDAKGHFYMDPEEGIFYCHKCGEKGNLITLQKHYGDYEERKAIYRPRTKPQGAVKEAFPDKDGPFTVPEEKKATDAHHRLLADQEAVRYVTEARGIAIETVKRFKVGLDVDRDGSRWLTIPHYEKGKLINIKSRSLPPAKKTFLRVKDCRSILFNADAIQGNRDEILITEGEIDALTLITHGIENVVAATNGAGSFDPSWIDQLQAVKKIIICYDPDEAGQKGARELARRLGYERCFNAALPEDLDVNDYFQEGNDAVAFRELLEDARQFDVAGIMTFADGLKKYREEIQRPEQATGIRTGWTDVDRIVKTGFMPGELIVLSAPPKIGKSTFALQIITHNALQDIPALFFCLEMRPL
ncbi:MAG TPA: toprim domain-containing protein [Syntrophales bacterium]|nr:toprim domain-containing protein [Syntrophales bacterium]